MGKIQPPPLDGTPRIPAPPQTRIDKKIKKALKDHSLSHDEYFKLLKEHYGSIPTAPEKIEAFNQFLAERIHSQTDPSLNIEELTQTLAQFSTGTTDTMIDFAKEPSATTHLEFLPPEESLPPSPLQEAYIPNPVSLGVGSKDNPLQTTRSQEPLPSDLQNMSLEEATQLLDTPDKVAALLGNIPYETSRFENMEGTIYTYTPRDTFDNYTGVCRDMHQLGAYILNQHGYEAVQMGYQSARTSHAFLLYREPETGRFGIIEYGRNYSPDEVEAAFMEQNGRKPSSFEDAFGFFRPDALMITRYSPATDPDKHGSDQSIFYTRTWENMIRNMKPAHENSFSYDTNYGFRQNIQNGRFGLSLGFNPQAPGAPVMQNSMFGNMGYQFGDRENYVNLYGGVQYLPNSFYLSVGPNKTIDNPSLLVGAGIQGQWLPSALDFDLGSGHRVYSTLGGELGGNLAFNKNYRDAEDGEEPGLSFDTGMSGGAHAVFLDVEQHHDYQQNNVRLENTLFLHHSPAQQVFSTHLFANIGASSTLVVNPGGGPWSVDAGAQVLLKQVDNRDSTGVRTGVRYQGEKFSFSTSSAYTAPYLYGVGSTEMGRLNFDQSVAYQPIKHLRFKAGMTEEVILDKNQGAYTNPDSIRAHGAIEGVF